MLGTTRDSRYSLPLGETVTDNLHLAEQNSALIATALDGESVAMPVVGHVEDDENPVRMLAVALHHAQTAISALTDEVRDLRNEVDRLGGDPSRITTDDLHRLGLDTP
jgi:hypothetical protein